jgi:hypothetical protein
MPTGDPQLLVSVLTGETEMGFIRFVPDQPVPALTVGLDGNWQVAAPGVTPAHFSLLFDGQRLYVAALSPDAPVYINGTPIDGRWWMLSAPAELRFGHACLRVTFETPSSPAPGPRRPGASAPDVGPQAGAVATVLGAAAQWDLQHRDEPQPGGGKRTQLYDPSVLPQRPAARGQAPAPAARAPAPDPAPRAAPVAAAARGAPADGIDDGRPPLPGEHPDLSPAVGGSSSTGRGRAPFRRSVQPLRCRRWDLPGREPRRSRSMLRCGSIAPKRTSLR